MSEATDERILHRLKSRGAQTAAEMAAHLDITPAGARQHLARLEAADLVAGETRRQKRGRPRKLYRLTDRGHGRFPDRHSELTLELLQATRTVFGKAGLDRLILHREQESLAAYRRELATGHSLHDKLAALARIRDREGYMARVEKEPGGTFLLVEDHCPICAAAASCQALCRSELDIFRAVLGAGVHVERVDHVLAGARRCAYRISSTA